ncbi:hypothetical protein FSHL1_007513 [Fusarium sambucinum]
MPTATEFFGITITNFGRLTTTYTHPPSCTTATTDHLLYAIENVTGPYHGSPSCEQDSVGDCIPDGSSYDLLVSKGVSPWELGSSTGSSPQILQPDEIWLSLLEPAETLAFCCPSGWDGIELGVCATSIEHFTSYNHSGICVRE